MLIRRTAILTLALCLAVVSDSAQSQRGSRSNPPRTESAQPAAPEQRGTDQSPFTVKILPGPDSKERTDKEERERQEKAAVDKKLADETQRIADDTFWLGMFTLALFFVALGQIALFWKQLRLIRESLVDAKVAADAAKAAANTAQKQVELARDEFNSTHRPKIRLKHIWLTSDIWAGESIIVNIVFGNNGTAEAFLNEAGIHFIIVRKGQSLPPDPSMTPNITHAIAGRTLGIGYSLRIDQVTDGTVRGS